MLPLPPGASDDQRIAHERANRLFRYTWGLPLPGEPSLGNLEARLASGGWTPGAPIFIRIFKKEFELEFWMKRGATFQKFATYPICRWSGGLGPKFQTGDKQAPEGFYTVDAAALNPNSRWYRSFNLGFPNLFDKAHGRTGSFIMVHGGCGSVGCYAMTNPQIDEIWKLVTAALNGGQKRFQVQVFPFRMTDDALAPYAAHEALPFWKSLKHGHDLFEQSSVPPRVSVCNGQYAFERGSSASNGDAPIESGCPQSKAKQS